MKHIKRFPNKNISTFEDFTSVSEGIIPKFNLRELIKSIFKKFPQVEKYWDDIIGKKLSQGKFIFSRATSWGKVGTALREFDLKLLTFAKDKFSNLTEISNLINEKNVIAKINPEHGGSDTFLRSDKSIDNGIYLHELLTILNFWTKNQISTKDLLTCIPESTVDNPNFRAMFGLALDRVGKGLRTNFESLEAFFKHITESYPMTKEEAQKIINDFGGKVKAEKTFKEQCTNYGGGNSFWHVNGDNILAAFIKHKFEVPVQNYLYHGTTTKNLPGIKAHGLDNSLRPEGIPQSNPGAFYAAPGHFFGTADMSSAREFSGWGAKRLNAEPALIRFPNEKGKKLGEGGIFKAVDSQKLEYSLDGGKTWQQIKNFPTYTVNGTTKVRK